MTKFDNFEMETSNSSFICLLLTKYQKSWWKDNTIFRNLNFPVNLGYLTPQSMIRNSQIFIRKTCPCNVYPLEPHFYIAKLGYAGVYLFFLFLLKNIDCGYSLKPPRRAGSTCTHNLFFEQNKKNINNFPLKIIDF